VFFWWFVLTQKAQRIILRGSLGHCSFHVLCSMILFFILKYHLLAITARERKYDSKCFEILLKLGNGLSISLKSSWD
jgi:hypothetical protein